MPDQKKRLSGHALEPGQVYAAAREQIEVGLAEIFSDDGDDPDLGEEARRKGDVRTRAAQHSLNAPVRRLDTVISDRTHDHKRHALIVFQAARAALTQVQPLPRPMKTMPITISSSPANLLRVSRSLKKRRDQISAQM